MQLVLYLSFIAMMLGFNCFRQIYIRHEKLDVSNLEKLFYSRQENIRHVVFRHKTKNIINICLA
ncbi:hypothetical protein BpHYR1_046345 [Brachionus plicatilis]|uniref:Uncharacterized protein n=1 Tax=Brachionus plicatilis TaxID=10195 RepID=A0A3M7PHD5_BRAPC|nr:hypothetical protein BpHYR1_046345 [Brachionus plicatilis]